jgi:hypothetical protein
MEAHSAIFKCRLYKRKKVGNIDSNSYDEIQTKNRLVGDGIPCKI